MRCCGRLRASDGGTRAVAGPEMSPPRHPPSAGPARSRTLQPLGERVNRTCGQSCSVRRRPLCHRLDPLALPNLKRASPRGWRC